MSAKKIYIFLCEIRNECYHKNVKACKQKSRIFIDARKAIFANNNCNDLSALSSCDCVVEQLTNIVKNLEQEISELKQKLQNYEN